MYYIERTKETVDQLPSYYAGMSREEMVFRGVLPLLDEGSSKALPIAAKIEKSDNVFVQCYISLDEFSSIKETKLSQLNRVYESRVDLLVRKSAQDLAFGDIQEIPKKVVAQREQYKIEYHEKVAAINVAQNVPELNAIPM